MKSTEERIRELLADIYDQRGQRQDASENKRRHQQPNERPFVPTGPNEDMLTSDPMRPSPSNPTGENKDTGKRTVPPGVQQAPQSPTEAPDMRGVQTSQPDRNRINTTPETVDSRAQAPAGDNNDQIESELNKMDEREREEQREEQKEQGGRNVHYDEDSSNYATPGDMVDVRAENMDPANGKKYFPNNKANVEGLSADNQSYIISPSGGSIDDSVKQLVPRKEVDRYNSSYSDKSSEEGAEKMKESPDVPNIGRGEEIDEEKDARRFVSSKQKYDVVSSSGPVKKVGSGSVGKVIEDYNKMMFPNNYLNKEASEYTDYNYENMTRDIDLDFKVYSPGLFDDDEMVKIIRDHSNSISRFRQGMPPEISPAHILKVYDRVTFPGGGFAKVISIDDEGNIWLRNLTEANGRGKGEDYKYTGPKGSIKYVWNIKSHRGDPNIIVANKVKVAVSKISPGDVVADAWRPGGPLGLVLSVNLNKEAANIRWSDDTLSFDRGFDLIAKVGSVLPQINSDVDLNKSKLIDVTSDGSVHVVDLERNKVATNKLSQYKVDIGNYKKYAKMDEIFEDVNSVIRELSGSIDVSEYGDSPDVVKDTDLGKINIFVNRKDPNKFACRVSKKQYDDIKLEYFDGYEEVRKKTSKNNVTVELQPKGDLLIQKVSEILGNGDDDGE